MTRRRRRRWKLRRVSERQRTEESLRCRRRRRGNAGMTAAQPFLGSMYHTLFSASTSSPPPSFSSLRAAAAAAEWAPERDLFISLLPPPPADVTIHHAVADIKWICLEQSQRAAAAAAKLDPRRDAKLGQSPSSPGGDGEAKMRFCFCPLTGHIDIITKDEVCGYNGYLGINLQYGSSP